MNHNINFSFFNPPQNFSPAFIIFGLIPYSVSFDHTTSNPIPFPSSSPQSVSTSTRFQSSSSLTSNSTLIPEPVSLSLFLPTTSILLHILRSLPLHFHVFLSINHPVHLAATLFLLHESSVFLHSTLRPRLQLSLTSYPVFATSSFSIFSPPHPSASTHSTDNVVSPGRFVTSTVKIRRAGCRWHARGTTTTHRFAVETTPRDSRDHYAASSTSRRRETTIAAFSSPNHHTLFPAITRWLSRLLLLLLLVSWLVGSSKYTSALYSLGNVDLVERGVNAERRAGGKCQGSEASTSTFRGISSESWHNWYFRDIVPRLRSR